MKKLFKKISKNKKLIEEIQAQMECVKTLPHYSIFRLEGDREKDLAICNDALKTQYDIKQLLLESLQIEINKELHRVSQAQRSCTLLKTA